MLENRLLEEINRNPKITWQIWAAQGFFGVMVTQLAGVLRKRAGGRKTGR